MGGGPFTYGVADMGTTFAIVDAPGVIEGISVVRAMVAGFGGAGLAALKLCVLLVGIVYSARACETWFLPPPLLAAVGITVVLYNVGLLGR